MWLVHDNIFPEIGLKLFSLRCISLFLSVTVSVFPSICFYAQIRNVYRNSWMETKVKVQQINDNRQKTCDLWVHQGMLSEQIPTFHGPLSSLPSRFSCFHSLLSLIFDSDYITQRKHLNNSYWETFYLWLLTWSNHSPTTSRLEFKLILAHIGLGKVFVPLGFSVNR